MPMMPHMTAQVTERRQRISIARGETRHEISVAGANFRDWFRPISGSPEAGQHHLTQFLCRRLGEGLGGRFDHDADQRLGTARTNEDSALTVQ